ncbi:hypothetical protein L6164_005614 [Bauhinia variegata]|uniref:Uncharacterized protein n=1 Tax=Bauhinia variegata TaxID=167791 RepID=A0ACB9PR68_BAUVA|nr:hypothetical protein L6164_005614 [Bauhinia variegata]
MATSREENPYEGGGLGTGGKFPKRPFRRSTHTTPYDRPATAVRNPSGNNSWLSKLVDPAQRLITYSAHRLFSSVRKRLGAPPPPTPPQQPSSAIEQEVRDDHLEAAAFVINDSSQDKQEVEETGIQTNCSDRGGFTELEKLLKQKTFTRSEVDRLTALLHSKTVDSPVRVQKRTEGVPSELISSHEQKEEFPKTPALENGVESHLVSTSVFNSSALDEDVASPAELAKAYMGSRQSKVSPSILSLQSPALREDTTPLKHQYFPPKSSVLPIVPRTSSQTRVPENGSITSRSRGRSAIYSMARTPYARVYPTSTSKAVEGGPSSSYHSPLDHDNPSGSKQGALKRRSSVLENDIGTLGPIRRIRHKSNLLTSRALSFPVSGSPLSIARSGAGVSATPQPSSSMRNTPLTGEAMHNRDDTMPSTIIPPLPTKSTEMATKILQQLDKLVSPKEKSSQLKLPTVTKLSPSMLHGQARLSMETVDSSKFLHNIGDDKVDASVENLSAGGQKISSMTQNKVENGPLKLLATSDATIADATVPSRQTPSSSKSVGSSMMKPVSYPPQKKRAFHMSAHEDYLELDDDDGIPNGVASGKEKTNFTAVTGNIVSTTENILQDKPPASSIFKPLKSSVLDDKTNVGTADGSMVDEEVAISTSVTPSSSPTLTTGTVAAARQPVLGSDKATSPNGSIAAPSFGNKVASSAELTATAPKFGFGEKIDSSKESVTDASGFNFSTNKISDNVPKMPFKFGGESMGSKFGVSSDSKSENLISPTTVGSATDSMPKVPESVNGDGKTNLVTGFSVRSSEPSVSSTALTSLSTSTTGIFTFGHSSNQNNGSLASSPSFPSSQFAPLVTHNSSSQNSLSSSFCLTSSNTSNTAASSTSTGTGTGTPVSTPAITASTTSSFSNSAVSSSPAPTIFKFGTSLSPSTSLPISTSVSEPVEIKTRQDSGFGNLSSTPFGTSSAAGGTGSSIFRFNTSAVTSVNNQSEVPGFTADSGSALGANNQSQGSLFSSGSGSALGANNQSQGAVSSSGFGSISGTNSQSQGTVSSSGDGPAFGTNGQSQGTVPTSGSGSSLVTNSQSQGFVFSSGSGLALSANNQSQGSVFSSSSGSAFGANNQSQGSIFSASGGSALGGQVSPATTGFAPSTQSQPFQFGSSPSFGLAGNTALSSGNSVFASSSPATNVFNPGTTFGLTPTSSSAANSVSSNSGTTSSPFGASSWQPSKSPFGNTFSSTSSGFSFGASNASSSSSSVFSFGASTASSSSSGFSFGASTSASATSSPLVFGSSNGASSSPLFSFASAATTSTQPVFPAPNSAFTFNSAPSSNNNDQMSMEDSMAEDAVQATPPAAAPIFGQQPASQSNFVFGAQTPSGSSPFQFGSQQNVNVTPPNPSPFQASGTLDFNAGGSFSLGTGGDKSGRRILKVKGKHRKK